MSGPIEFPPAWAHELAVAVDAARAAGAVIRRHYAAGFDVDYKDAKRSDPVTAADREANQLIVQALRDAFPDDAILAEESADDVAARQARERLWCVDPLDGTREFVDRNGQFVVMIGVALAGRAVAGVVYQPTDDVLWWGAAGVAAEVRGDGSARLRVSTRTDPSSATLMVSRSHRSRTVSAVAARLGLERQMPLGSVGLKISRIVLGAADAYVSVSQKTKEWDACAPEAIVRAAGGEMTDCRGEPLLYNKDDVHTPYGLVATNGHLHKACIAALEPVVSERGW